MASSPVVVLWILSEGERENQRERSLVDREGSGTNGLSWTPACLPARPHVGSIFDSTSAST